MRLVKAAKAYPHAKFYNLSTGYMNQVLKFLATGYNFSLDILINIFIHHFCFFIQRDLKEN